MVSITWAARGRTISGPASAASAAITLRGATTEQGDLRFTVSRGSNNDAFTGTYTAPAAVRAGSWPLLVQFFAQDGATGDLVAVANTSATVSPETTNVVSVVTQSRVATLVANAPSPLKVGERQDLTFTAKTAEGSVLAIAPDAPLFSVLTGNEKLGIDGRTATGLAPGDASVVVTLDGKTSEPASVSVTSDAVVRISPAENASLDVGASQQFTAEVANAPNGTVVWSVAEGVEGGSVTTDGKYTAPNRAGTYHVRATSVYDTAKSETVAVVVHPILTLTPPATSVPVGGTLALSATLTGLADQTLLWSVQEGSTGGTISANGYYTAPFAVGTYHVVVASQADPSLQATVAVVVEGGSGTVIIQ